MVLLSLSLLLSLLFLFVRGIKWLFSQLLYPPQGKILMNYNLLLSGSCWEYSSFILQYILNKVFLTEYFPSLVFFFGCLLFFVCFFFYKRTKTTCRKIFSYNSKNCFIVFIPISSLAKHKQDFLRHSINSGWKQVYEYSDQWFNKNHSSYFPRLDFMFSKQPSDYNLSQSFVFRKRTQYTLWKNLVLICLTPN